MRGKNYVLHHYSGLMDKYYLSMFVMNLCTLLNVTRLVAGYIVGTC